MSLPGLGSLPGLPGLGVATSGSSSAARAQESTEENRTVTVPAGSEWRFEVPFGATTNVQIRPLVDTAYNEDDAPSIAELFGTELVQDAPYKFSGVKAAIYSHVGCRIDITGSKLEADYVADETSVLTYANIHFALENIRATATAARGRNQSPDDAPAGPRVLVIGPENSGKTSLIKTLTAYAVRSGRSPCVVNLDPREGMLAPPGSISAAVFGTGAQMDVEDAGNAGWGSSGLQGAGALATKMPLVYHIGVERPEEAMDVFGPVTTRMALAVTSRYEEDEGVKESGIIIDLAGSVCSNKGGAEVIDHVISEFSITAILVVGSERTASDLLKKHPSNPSDPSVPVILKLPKPGGAVDRDAAYLRALRTEQVKQYFFGSRTQPLSPHTSVLDAGLLQVFRMPTPEEIALNRQFQPGDMAGLGGPGYGIGPLTQAAVGCLLAIKHAGQADAQETIRDAAVLGFLYVAEVDADKKRVRVLSPVGGRLPDRAMVLGRWPEAVSELVG